MRRRILRLAVATALLALLLFGLPLGIAVRAVYLDDEHTELAHVAEQAAATVSLDGIRGSDPIELPAAEPDVTIGVYDADGRRITGDGPAALGPDDSRALSGQLADISGARGLRVAVPVRQGEEVVGLVRAATTTGSADRRAILAWASMLGLAALALLVAALTARHQAGRLAGPLTRLADAAHALGRGDFTVRFPGSGIPEIDTVGTALDTTADRLRDLLTRERAFSAHASHQLRTPLTGLRLTLEAASTGTDAALRAAAVDAIAATDRLERIVEDLLAIARADTADRTALDVGALLDDLHAERLTAFTARGRALRVEQDGPLAEVTASPRAVHQVLAVLIDNALRHGAGVTTLRARDAAGALALDVIDQGPGVAESARPRLFERSPDSSAGLGLSIAAALAEAEGGRLVLTSAGRPTTFTLFLPADEPALRDPLVRPSPDITAVQARPDP
ncbi:sensor histidine kinase [Krasilnikovia sp. MM14-A1004]|uniref:sensor histidine kinase n=1 Tax=Krasilnikovia sp. MM14-A1004 TaxID=3373541 RepID=UPI00399D0A70